jgi:hypothetical protein
LVEDSAALDEAVKQLLELLGASVSGPAATTAAAESLLAQRLPDVALLDFHLRGGERSDGLIAQLHLNFPHRHGWLTRRSLRSRSAKRSVLLTWAPLLPKPEAMRADDNGASARGHVHERKMKALGRLMLPRIDKAGDDGLFAKCLRGLQPVQTLN